MAKRKATYEDCAQNVNRNRPGKFQAIVQSSDPLSMQRTIRQKMAKGNSLGDDRQQKSLFGWH